MKYVDYSGNKADNSRPNVIKGRTYGVSYVASYTSRVMTINKTEWNYNFNLSLDKINAFAAFHGYIIKISNWQDSLTKIFINRKTKALASVLLMLSRKIRKDSLSGRSVDGTAFELLAHYVWYKKGILKSHTTETDCGGTNRKSIGFDNNAYIFEKDKSLLPKLENYVAKNKLNSAVILLSKTLAKLGWNKVK